MRILARREQLVGVGMPFISVVFILLPPCTSHDLMAISVLSRCGLTVHICSPHFEVPDGLCFAVIKYMLFVHIRPIILLTQSTDAHLLLFSHSPALYIINKDFYNDIFFWFIDKIYL